VAPNVVHVPGEANASLAKPHPPWTLRALLLKSVLLPRAALQTDLPHRFGRDFSFYLLINQVFSRS